MFKLSFKDRTVLRPNRVVKAGRKTFFAVLLFFSPVDFFPRIPSEIDRREVGEKAKVKSSSLTGAESQLLTRVA